MKNSLYSFDIFDTILIRKTYSSHDIFSIMEQNEFIKYRFKNTFRKERIFAEKKARLFKKTKTTIYDIYNVLAKKFSLTKSDIDTIIKQELEAEIKSTYLNKVIDNQISGLIKAGNKVCLISDMYWPSSFIKKILVSKNIGYADIPIFISCDYGKEKKNGKIFKTIKNVFNVEYKNWNHYGDNIEADYKVPLKLGINATFVKPQKCFKFEENIDFSNEKLANMYGLIKQLRETQNKEYVLGCSISGPLVYEYVNWVLNRAINKKIDHLYFVLRDGYVLKKAADILINIRNLPIKTDYIFGSRIAWRLPTLDVDTIKKVSRWDKSNWIFRDPCYAYICYERLGFNKVSLISLFGEEFTNRELITFNEFKKSITDALQNEKFVEQLNENIKISKENLVGYLKQTINFKERFALVDTNSTGKSQTDLNSIVGTFTKRFKIPFFYHTYLSNNIDSKTQFAFINDVKDDVRFPEALFRAPYNTCYGYKNLSGNFEPVFFNNKYCAWYGTFLYDDYLKGVIDFCDCFEKSKILDCSDYSKMLIDVVNFRIKSLDLYKILAKIPFNPNMEGAEKNDFYPDIHFSTLLHPFKELIYYPKGSYYCKNIFYLLIYKALFSLVSLKRRSK